MSFPLPGGSNVFSDAYTPLRVGALGNSGVAVRLGSGPPGLSARLSLLRRGGTEFSDGHSLLRVKDPGFSDAVTPLRVGPYVFSGAYTPLRVGGVGDSALAFRRGGGSSGVSVRLSLLRLGDVDASDEYSPPRVEHPGFSAATIPLWFMRSGRGDASSPPVDRRRAVARRRRGNYESLCFTLGTELARRKTCHARSYRRLKRETSRSTSRCEAFFLRSSRLSWASLPLATPSSTFTRESFQ